MSSTDRDEMDNGGSRGPRPQLKEKLAAYRETRGERQRTIPPRAAVPSFFTLMNLFSGFLAIIQVSEGRFQYAAWLIVLAGFFDLLDGIMARLAHADSDFGIQLDSLSDMVSFGVAPAFLLYRFGLDRFGMLGLMVAALPAICGAVRLARFNTTATGEKKGFYYGLPIPVQAATIVTFILTFRNPAMFERFALGRLSVLIPFVVVLSALMVTTIRFDALPKLRGESNQQNRIRIVLFGIGTLLSLFLQEIGLFISMIGYIVLNVGRATLFFSKAIWNAGTDTTRNE